MEESAHAWSRADPASASVLPPTHVSWAEGCVGGEELGACGSLVFLSHRLPPALWMEKSHCGFAAGQAWANGSGGGGTPEPEEAPMLGATTAEEPSCSLGETDR